MAKMEELASLEDNGVKRGLNEGKLSHTQGKNLSPCLATRMDDFGGVDH